MGVFPNTRAWEQQEWNKDTEKGKKRGMSMERSKAGTKENEVLTAITTQSKYNNNKYNMVVFYKICKN